jgi:Holliday junction resolvase RusA-like endonuclease
MTEPRGKAYLAIKPRGSKFAKLALSEVCDDFEKDVCRIASQVLPAFPLGTMLGIRVESVKKRPKSLFGKDPARIPCPVKPDAANVTKCCEDALMRCRLCNKRKAQCRKIAGHMFSPTLVDDSWIVDDGCRTWYSAVQKLGKAKKTWRAKPSRVEVLVWVVR